MTDLLALTEELCAVPSVSGDEAALADLVEAQLARAGARASTSTRLGANVVARTQRGAATRVVLGGHLDTVPVEQQRDARAATATRCTASVPPT